MSPGTALATSSRGGCAGRTAVVCASARPGPVHVGADSASRGERSLSPAPVCRGGRAPCSHSLAPEWLPVSAGQKLYPASLWEPIWVSPAGTQARACWPSLPPSSLCPLRAELGAPHPL